MANFEVSESYNSVIEKLEPTTPGHADNFNKIFQQLINNDAFIKKELTELINKDDYVETNINKLITDLSTHNHDNRYCKKSDILTFTNKTISLWVEDSTYEDYSYHADIACDEVTSEYTPNVIFNMEDATSGILAPVADTGDGYVRIYASEALESEITIPKIICERW